ncbi:MAG: hypothetical protein QMD02_08675, partial [Bacteroidales bacterium]|nr:hypothetical protein [Bacteroidales bacterium]
GKAMKLNRILCIPVSLMLLLAVTVVPTMACSPYSRCGATLSNSEAKIINTTASSNDIIEKALSSAKVKAIGQELTNSKYEIKDKRSYIYNVKEEINGTGTVYESNTPIALIIYSNGTSEKTILYTYNKTTGLSAILLLNDPSSNSLNPNMLYSEYTDQDWLCFFAVVACLGSSAVVGATCGTAALTWFTLATVLACIGGIGADIYVCVNAMHICHEAGWI